MATIVLTVDILVKSEGLVELKTRKLFFGTYVDDVLRKPDNIYCVAMRGETSYESHNEIFVFWLARMR